jgi:predicted amidohydrolase YtcJ
MAATVVLRRARIHSPGRGDSASALAIRNGRVVALGGDAEVWAAVGSDAPSVDLGGRVVLPGFIDAHLHWAGYALQRRRLDLDPGLSLAEVQRRVRQVTTGPSEDTWLVGRGWDHSRWGRWPTASDLDQVVPDRPAMLIRKDGHAVWLNSRGLATCHIGAETPDPPGGQVQRAAGQPTGVLLENAVRLAYAAIPEPDPVERQAAMIDAWPDAWSRGLTGVHDMGFGDTALFRDLATLRDAGELGLRFVWYLPQASLEEALALGLRSGLGDDWLRVGGLKLFLDGTLGSQTAHLLDPYEGQPGQWGEPVMSYEDFVATVDLAAGNGLATAVHAIGDAAVRRALDGFAAVPAGRAGDGRAQRRRIEHCQLVDPADRPRFAALGITASVQPVHLLADAEIAERYWGERCANAYAWRSLADAGAALAFGSDAPVEPLDVFAGLDAAVNRQVPGRGAWRPGERLSAQEALRAYTLGPAEAAGVAQSLGSLEPGRRADLIVLDRDPLTAAADLARVAVLATMIDGVWVWQAPRMDLAGPRLLA